MTCPICAGKTTIPTTRDNVDHVVRFRKCTECGHIFKTLEVDEDIYHHRQKGSSLSDLYSDATNYHANNK